MFDYIIHVQLSHLMSPQTKLDTSQLKKLRDLFIGIVLNMSCNIEDTEIMMKLVNEHNLIQTLIKILKDQR